MHRYYDPRLFDMALKEEDVINLYGVRDSSGVPQPELLTSEDFVNAGFNVHLYGPGDGECEDGNDVSGNVTRDTISQQIFTKWLEVAGFSLGSVVQRWWEREPPIARGSIELGKMSWDEGPVELYLRIASDLAEGGLRVDEGVSVAALVQWLSDKIGDAFNHNGSRDEEVLIDEARFEFAIFGRSWS